MTADSKKEKKNHKIFAKEFKFFGRSERMWVAEVWVVISQHLVLKQIALLKSFDTKDVTVEAGAMINVENDL